MRFSYRGPTTMRCTKMPGVWTCVGIELADLDELLDLGDRDLRRPSPIIGLKFRAVLR